MQPSTLINSEATAFNSDILNQASYDERRSVLSTKTVYFDELREYRCTFAIPAVGWCNIPAELEASFCKLPDKANIFRIDRKASEISGRSSAIIADLMAGQEELLRILVSHYIDCHEYGSAHFLDKHSQGISRNLNKARVEFVTNFTNLISQESSTGFLRRMLTGRNPDEKQIKSQAPRKVDQAEIRDNVIKLKSEGNLTVPRICEEAGISQTQYYRIRKKIAWRERGRKLQEERKEYCEEEKNQKIKAIKELADDPLKSFTLGEMSRKLEEKFKTHTSKEFVWYHLNKTLGYSRKKTHFRTVKAFGKGQRVLDYLVCAGVTREIQHGKLLFYIDESGFEYEHHSNFSYSKIGEASIKAGAKSAQKLHLIMEVSRNQVFAYCIRKQGFNELAFTAFLISICSKYHSMEELVYKDIALYFDNAAFHKSKLAMRFLSLIPLKIIFGSPSNCDLSMIENVFGILKARLRSAKYSSLYFVGESARCIGTRWRAGCARRWRRWSRGCCAGPTRTR